MKEHYFFQRVADQDDRLLERFKAEGKVPPGCLLGGAMVQVQLEQGIDPCSSCPGPRNKCGGRPRGDKGSYLETEEVERMIHQSDLDTITRQQLERAAEVAGLIADYFPE